MTFLIGNVGDNYSLKWDFSHRYFDFCHQNQINVTNIHENPCLKSSKIPKLAHLSFYVKYIVENVTLVQRFDRVLHKITKHTFQIDAYFLIGSFSDAQQRHHLCR